MTAWQRTNIVEREEKGIGPITFKRLIISGGAGLLITMLMGRITGFGTGCAAGGFIIALILLITHPKDGFPLYAYFARVLRGLATVAAVNGKTGLMEVIGRGMQVKAEDGILSADVVFDAQDTADNDAPVLTGEWAYLGTFGDADDVGLAATENPFVAEIVRGQ